MTYIIQLGTMHVPQSAWELCTQAVTFVLQCGHTIHVVLKLKQKA